jgi:hypothetical protein
MKELDSDKHSMLDMARLIDDWKQNNHIDAYHNIIFQNKELLTNVKLPSNYLHQGHVNSRGFENLPETIMNPSEVWSYWKDSDKKKQFDACRNYLIFGGDINYCVTTEAGVIKKAQAVVPSKIDRLRKGLIIYRNK